MSLTAFNRIRREAAEPKEVTPTPAANPAELKKAEKPKKATKTERGE